MTRPRTHRACALAIFAAAGLAVTIPQTLAQDGQTAATPSPETRIRFSFAGVPYSDVLDFFARETGLPVIREAAAPNGTMNFISAADYSFAEALEILNLTLRMHSVQLVREQNFLYLRTLQDAARTPVKVANGDDLGDLDRSQYVTVTIPLSNALAGQVATQVQPLIKEPGLVQPIDAQNMLVVVETAPQIERIRELVAGIDAVRPQSSDLRVFALEHMRAAQAANTLRGLVPEREQIMEIDKQGNPKIVDDVSKPPLKISHDDRLNAVVAVGPSDRLSTVEELVLLLDRADGTISNRPEELVSYRLASVTPRDAAAQLDALFRALPEQRQPKVIPLDAAGKIVVVGDPDHVAQAQALLGELDPAALDPNADTSTGVRRIDLAFLDPGNADRLARRLLTARQAQMLRTAPTPDNRALIAAGPSADLDALGSLLDGLDRRPDTADEVRRVRLNAETAPRALEEAQRIDGLADASRRDPVEALLDRATGTVLLVGSRAGISRFERILVEAEREIGPRREQRQFEVEHHVPSRIAGDLTRAVTSVLRPAEGSPFTPPEIEAVDSLGLLLVRATPDQFQTLEQTLDQLDRPSVSGRTSRVVGAFGTDPQGVLRRAQEQYALRTEGADPRQAGAIDAEYDADAGRFVLSGNAQGVRTFEQVLNDLRQLEPPARRSRTYTLRTADAADVIEPLRAMLSQAGPVDPVRRERAPEIVVDAALPNALRIVADDAQHRRISEFVRLLDRPERESRSFVLETATPSQVVGQLQRLSRPLLTPDDGSPFTPPTFEALDELRTLIVRADPDQFAAIGELVERLDDVRPGDRTVQIVRVRTDEPDGLVKRARELFDVDATGREGQLGEVETEYDRASGSLILRGKPEAVRLFQNALNRAQQLMPPVRSTRLIDVRNTDAQTVLEPLQQLLASAGPVDPARRVPDPDIRVVARTNSLLITAEDAQHRLINDYVRRLDVVDQSDLPPLKLLSVRLADVNAVASMLNQQYSQRPRTERQAKPVQIRADAATGTLIVSAHEDLLPDIQAFVDELNEERTDGPERETFIFPLKVARAEAVAVAMDKLYPQPPVPLDRRGRPIPWLREPKEVTVSADPSSNSLIIDAPTDRRESLIRLAETLDRVEVPPVAELRTYQIVGADPNAVSRMLQGLARRGTLSGPAQPGKQKVDVVIEVEPKSSTLIVAGDDVTFEKVEAVLDDLTAIPIERGLRIVPIANVPAEEIRERAVTIYRSQISQIPGAGPVDVTVDDETNSLEVVADRDAMTRFMRILQELQDQVGPAREVRLIELRLARAAETVEFLREMASKSESLRADGGPEPVFEPIESTNAIMVAAQPAQFRIIEPLIRSLDNRQTAERPPLRILRLRSTDAQGIAQVLSRSYQQRSPEDRALRPVSIQADATTNTLIISAHEELLPEIEAIVQDLNESQAFDSEGREIRVFPLRVARAEDLAKTIDQMYPEPPMPRDSRGRPLPHLQGRKEVFVRADPVTNSLIVDAPGQRLSGFERLVENLDTLNVGEDVEVRTYRVERADASAVGQAIQRLASSGALAAAGRTAVTVSVEPSTKALVVSGPAASFEQIEALVSELDGPVERAMTVLRLYQLEHARAERLVDMVRRLLAARLREQRALGDADGLGEETLEVAADRASNTLIINGPETLQEIAQSLIDALDTEAAEIGQATVKVAPLTYADAREVARTVSDSLRTMDLPSGDASLVRIVAAASSNALVMSGPKADLEAIHELVEPLDRQPFDPEKASVETFPLDFADARSIAQTVQRLLVDQQANDPRLLMAQLRYTRGRLPQQTPIRVEAEPRTNALIVSGPAQTIELARSVIERLDAEAPVEDRRVLTYTPVRADPARLAKAVERVAAETLPKGRLPVEITAEPTSGSVLVIGTDEQATGAVRLLADFDERSPAAPTAEVRTIGLEYADATAVARTVSGMLSDRSRWPDSVKLAADAGLAVTAPRVDADRATNRVLVSVPAPLMGMAEELVAALDEPRATGAVDVRVFRLESGNAQSVSATLREALGSGLGPGEPRPSVSAELASNSVVIAASRTVLDRAAALITEMDATAAAPSEVEVRTVFLDFARAETLAPIVLSVLSESDPIDDLPFWYRETARAERFRRGTEIDAAKVRVEPEPRLNALIVSAPEPTLELAEQVVRELDIDPRSRGGGRVVRVLTLENADATELAANVEAVFADDPGATRPPTIRVDSSSNSLIVSATRDQMTLVETLASDLDKATLRTGRQFRTIPIDRSRADAADVARTLRRLLEQRGGVRVNVVGIDDLLDEGDDEGPVEEPVEGPVGEPAPLPGPGGSIEGRGLGRFEFIETVVVSLAMAQVSLPERDDDSDGASEITIAVDPLTNSLVVVGSPRATDRLAELASEVERQIPAEPTAVRFVELPGGADARQVANIINQTIRQVGRANANNPGGFTGRVAVTPDPNAGVVVVWANDTDFESIRGLIRGVSRLEKSRDVTVKVFPLTNVDSRSAARSVSDLFSGSPAGRQAQLLRGAEIELLGDGDSVKGRLDPRDVTVSAAPQGGQLIISAPSEAMDLIDRFVSLIDQSPVAERMEIRRYELESAEARRLRGTLQSLMDSKRQGPGAWGVPRAVFVADDRTNTLLVTASSDQHTEIAALIETSDVSLEADDLTLEVITLEHTRPSVIERVVRDVVVGRDPGRAERVSLTAQDDAGVLIVRAGDEELGEIQELIAQVDVQEASSFPVRSIKLQEADAGVVARELQRFFQQRERVGRGGRGGRGGGAAIIGDSQSGTLVIAASDEDYEQIASLASQFDSRTTQTNTGFRIIPLQHIQGARIQSTLEELAWQTRFNRWNRQDEVAIEIDTATNSVILFGSGDSFEVFEEIIRELDQPRSDTGGRVVRVVPVPQGDLRSLERLIEETTRTPGYSFWRGDDPGQVRVEVDQARRVLFLIGPKPAVDEAVEQLEKIAESAGDGESVVETITLEHADASRAAAGLSRFFRDRARSQGKSGEGVTILGSRDGNALIVSGPPEELAVLRDLIAQMDQPELGDDRIIEVYGLSNADPNEVTRTVRAMFPRQGRREEEVIVTPQPSRSAIIVSAPTEAHARVAALIAELDTVDEDVANRIVTVQLESARANEVADALRRSLPDEVRVNITPVERSNSLLITGSDEAVNVVLEQVELLDTETIQSPVEFRRFELKHADAFDTSFTLREMVRSRPRRSGDPRPSIDWSSQGNAISVTASGDEMAFIEQMVAQLDVPEQDERRTEFVKLEFADAQQTGEALRVFYGPYAPEAASVAEREVTIVSDPASNSLVISADESLFDDIRALLEKLDTEEYDTSRQLVVIPLRHADAASVARALNEGFRAPLEDELARQRARDTQSRRSRNDDNNSGPTVLVTSEETPVVSAEVQTNSLIVFAGRNELERIQAIVERLDVPDFLSLPVARLVRVTGGTRASVLAQSVRSVFLNAQARQGSPTRAVIIGDDASSTLIVRAEAGEFDRIQELALSLMEESSRAEVMPRVIRLTSLNAPRIRQTLLAALRPLAERRGEPISIEADAGTNALIVSASSEVYDRAMALVDELETPVDDGPEQGVDDQQAQPNPDAELIAKARGGEVLIVDLEYTSPDEMLRLLNQLGVTRAPNPSRPSLVAEAVSVVPMETRRAIAITANANDADIVSGLARALDAEPSDSTQEAAVIPLRLADARRLVPLMESMLTATDGDGRSAPAAAIAEQVRRLELDSGGFDGSKIELDLSSPIRLIADEQANAVVVASTPDNVAAIRSVVELFDRLPVGDAVVVRLFPLENASATRVREMIEDLFRDGEALRRLPGTNRQGLPTTTTGQALAGEVSVTVDERTNTLIVAGRDEAVALVEVLINDLDQGEAASGVGLHVVPVPGADVSELAPKIRNLMRDRIRARQRAGGDERPEDVFTIEAVAASNVLIVAASDENLAIVEELISVFAAGGDGVDGGEVIEMVAVSRPGGAADIAEAVNELYVERENEKRGRGAVSVYPSERQNAIVVSGTPADVAAVRGIVARFDTQEGESAQEIKRITLRAANSFEIVNLVESLLAGRAISGSDGERQATKLRFYREELAALSGREPGTPESDLIEATIDEALRDRVRLTPDLRTNSVIVSAPPDIMSLIASIIDDLDDETRGDRRIARFRLENADAQQMALVLRDLFALEQQGDRLVLVPRGAVPGEEDRIEEVGPGTLTPVPDERQALAITVDRRTNTLLVSGTREYLDEVRDVVAELDSIEANARERFVYHLRNADAAELEVVLSNYFAGEAELLQSTLGPELSGSLARQLEQEVTVVGDPKSNKLLISASPRYIDAVKEIVSELDASPPQVMIQVLLAEVTLDDAVTWGMDINVGRTVETSNIGGDGYVFDSFAAGAGVATAIGAPNFGVASTDFSLLIRALEAQGKLEVLSRPQVTVNNNEAAFIQVGEDVGIVTGSDRIGERVTAEVERRDVGIILNVTPSISVDGFVRMDISPEISQVTTRTTQIDEDFESPIITQRRVETTVTVKDGQTVVIGGLIQTIAEVRETKVPFLGDIPILGLPFRSYLQENTKTELLVILTPVVIPGESPAAEFVQDELFDKTLRAVNDREPVIQALDRDPLLSPRDPEVFMPESIMMGPFLPGQEPPANWAVRREPLRSEGERGRRR
ncbi:MAG: secretin N-terminal domain-containing protein [Planctomycetota bacterium]